MRPGLRSWLRALPLQRRVAFLTTVAVALAVAVTSVAGYVTLRVSLYRALDEELVATAAALARGPVAEDLRTIGNLTERSVRADNLTVAVVRADGSTFFVPDARDKLVLGPKELAIARLRQGYSARSGVTETGEEFRIVAVPMSELGGYALVLGRTLQPTDDILSSLWLALIIFGVSGVIVAAIVGITVARSSLRPVRQLSAAVELRHRDQGADPDRDRRHRRHRGAGRVVQPDAAVAGLLAGTPGPADRRRRARAAYPVDQPADQHRAAGRGCPERHAHRAGPGRHPERRDRPAHRVHGADR